MQSVKRQSCWYTLFRQLLKEVHSSVSQAFYFLERDLWYLLFPVNFTLEVSNVYSEIISFDFTYVQFTFTILQYTFLFVSTKFLYKWLWSTHFEHTDRHEFDHDDPLCFFIVHFFRLEPLIFFFFFLCDSLLYKTKVNNGLRSRLSRNQVDQEISIYCKT